MGHEDAVYLAKLAEQAERYEGWFLLNLDLVAQISDNPTQRWLRT
jgi:hypothetical protein